MAKAKVKHRGAVRGDNRKRCGAGRTLAQRLGDKKRRK